MPKEEEYKILDKRSFDSLVKKLSKEDQNIYGEYQYNAHVIIIKKPKALNNLLKCRRFYKTRKSAGLCVYCGKKVTEINPKSQKPFRYCTDHRRMESLNKKIKRLEEKKNESTTSPADAKKIEKMIKRMRSEVKTYHTQKK